MRLKTRIHGRGWRLSAALTAAGLPLMLAALVVKAAPAATATVLYDGALGTLPTAQSFEFLSVGTLTQTWSGGATTLDSTLFTASYGGYGVAPAQAPTLNRLTGYTVLFTVQTITETHTGSDRNAGLARPLALAVAVAGFLVTLPLYTGFDRTTSAMQFVELAPWIPRFNIHYQLGVDGISVLFILLTAFFTPLVVLAGWQVIEKRVAQYMASFLIMSGIMIGVFAAFSTAEMINLRQMGLGLLVAVFLDATVVRLLLLPACVRLGGDACWNAPKFRHARAATAESR